MVVRAVVLARRNDVPTVSWVVARSCVGRLSHVLWLVVVSEHELRYHVNVSSCVCLWWVHLLLT